MAGFIPRRLEVPVVETERLRLREHRPQDFPDSAAMWADPVVTQYIGGKPLSEEDVWARVLRYVGHWAWLGFGYWVVEEKATGKFAGEMGAKEQSGDFRGRWRQYDGRHRNGKREPRGSHCQPRNVRDGLCIFDGAGC